MTGPDRIWVKPCFPCSEPDDYYVCHPQYLTAGATGYVRDDIHDEVRSYLASCIAMIEHAIGPGNDVFIEPDTKRRLSDARAALAEKGAGNG